MVPKQTKPRALNKSHIEIVFKVKEFFKHKKLHDQYLYVGDVAKTTAAATGVSRATVFKIGGQEDVDNWALEHGSKLRYNSKMVVPDNFAAVIRKIVRDIFLEKERVPTIDSVFERIKQYTVQDIQDCNLDSMEVVDEDMEVWKWSRATLHRYMQKIGFVYKNRVSYYQHTKERQDVVAMRDNYLEWIQYYRENNYEIFYQDETWVFKNLTKKMVWQDTEGEATKNIFNVPAGSGERSILCHLGSDKTGLLEGCMLLYRGSKALKNDDYHREMCWDVFSHWCENKVFPALKRRKTNVVLVLDRAKYHTFIDDDDKYPYKSWRKPRLANCVFRWGGPPDDWPLTWRERKTRRQLLECARSYFRTPKYAIQKIADKFEDEHGHIKIIFLPVAHPELNPIEMVWSFVKRSVASRNLNFSLPEVEKETRTQVAKVTQSEFAKYLGHSMKEEDRYRKLSEKWGEETETDSDVESQHEGNIILETDDPPDLISKGPSYCHVQGCIQEDKNSATGHTCTTCKRSVHSICCVRVLKIDVQDSTTPLYCSDCVSNK